MGSGFAKMKKQAKLMQQQIETLQNELSTKQFTGSSGNGLVTITLSGEKKLLDVTIKPECVDLNDLEGLQDLIRAAHQTAYQQIEQDPSSQLPLSGGIPFPLG